MNNIEINIGHPLKIKILCNEEHSDRPVTNKRILKRIQISTWCKVMLENIIRILDKTIWGEVETLGLYWFAQLAYAQFSFPSKQRV